MTEPVIRIEGLSRRFATLTAVDDVSFSVQRGAIFGLLGPNGSGKSTIIRMLLGILPLSSGRASVLGLDVESEAERIKPRVGYMSQQFSLYSDLSVRENLDFYGRIYGLDRAKLSERRDAVAQLTGIDDRLNQLAGTLSGRWKQRLALACSLIHQPEVIFLDELKLDRPWKEAPKATAKASGLGGMYAILVKEFFHIRRQPKTLFFMFIVPVIQTIIFRYAINTQIENIPTVVLDLDGRKESLMLTERFINTRRFKLVERVYDQSTFDSPLRSGHAQVGIVIPPNFSEQILHGEQVQLQVLIDGSDSQIATTAQNTAQLLGQNFSVQLATAKGESLQLAPARDREGHAVLPIDVRTRLLFNPDLKSSYFFVPGLVGVILQLVTLFLTSFAIVRERELGTLEQLFVTPISRTGLMLGKLVPYAAVGMIELLIMLTVMIFVFGVPISGSISLLLMLSMLFTVCSLGLGLLISTIAKTQLAGFQFAFIIMLPSILLSGFVFPRAEMPFPIYMVTFLLPATNFIEILRGIILRGAELADLTSSILGLAICTTVVLVASVFRFRKSL